MQEIHLIDSTKMNHIYNIINTSFGHFKNGDYSSAQLSLEAAIDMYISSIPHELLNDDIMHTNQDIGIFDKRHNKVLFDLHSLLNKLSQVQQ